jgi:RNAse (barnase) inhibitor barstar
MEPDFHLQPNEPPLALFPEVDADRAVWPLRCAPGAGAVRVIRGIKCETLEALFNEVGAALQFPDYFGENWDALDECIIDLEWMPAEWYLIHVDQVECVLPEDPADFRIFLRILLDAGRAWHDPESRGMAPPPASRSVPFNIILSGTDAGLARARAVLDEWTHAEPAPADSPSPLPDQQDAA